MSNCKKARREEPKRISLLNISSFFFFKVVQSFRSALPTYKYGAGCGASVLVLGFHQSRPAGGPTTAAILNLQLKRRLP